MGSNSFNADFYMAAVTVIPIFWVAIAVEFTAVGTYGRLPEVDYLRPWRERNSFLQGIGRMAWTFLVAIVASCTVMFFALSVATEAASFVALWQQEQLPFFLSHLVLVDVIALPMFSAGFWFLVALPGRLTSEPRKDRAAELDDRQLQSDAGDAAASPLSDARASPADEGSCR